MNDEDRGGQSEQGTLCPEIREGVSLVHIVPLGVNDIGWCRTGQRRLGAGEREGRGDGIGRFSKVGEVCICDGSV